MSDSDDELNNTAQIARERNVSGELFDLSVPTFNNHFGNESIEYAIKLIKEVEESQPNNYTPSRLLGNIYRFTGDFDLSLAPIALT